MQHWAVCAVYLLPLQLISDRPPMSLGDSLLCTWNSRPNLGPEGASTPRFMLLTTPGLQGCLRSADRSVAPAALLIL
ncbi:hypothetical protein GN956_G20629 [Arapaima gigas]